MFHMLRNAQEPETDLLAHFDDALTSGHCALDRRPDLIKLPQKFAAPAIAQTQPDYLGTDPDLSRAQRKVLVLGD